MHRGWRLRQASRDLRRILFHAALGEHRTRDVEHRFQAFRPEPQDLDKVHRSRSGDLSLTRQRAYWRFRLLQSSPHAVGGSFPDAEPLSGGPIQETTYTL